MIIMTIIIIVICIGCLFDGVHGRWRTSVQNRGAFVRNDLKVFLVWVSPLFSALVARMRLHWHYFHFLTFAIVVFVPCVVCWYSVSEESRLHGLKYLRKQRNFDEKIKGNNFRLLQLFIYMFVNLRRFLANLQRLSSQVNTFSVIHLNKTYGV